MHMKPLLLTGAAALAAAAVSMYSLFAGENTSVRVAPETRIAVYGGSLTDAKAYTRILENYLVACTGIRKVHFFQFGRANESAGDFAGRMEEDTAFFKPDITIINYGRHESAYTAYDQKRADIFYRDIQKVIDYAKKDGSHIILASPVSVDPVIFRKSVKDLASKVNHTLSEYSRELYEIAIRNKVAFADVNGDFHKVTKTAKEKFGEGYHISGPDGVNPWWNGHMVIAGTLLKKLGVKGHIADITLDMKGEMSAVSSGHSVKESKPGTMTIVSERYPYCFDPPRNPKPNDPGNIFNLFEVYPFQDEFNMFRLSVHGLQSAKAKVSWDKQTKEFTKEQLEKGINLAKEFPVNPFTEPFRKVSNTINAKQQFETEIYRTFVSLQYRANQLKISKDGKEAFKTVIAEIKKKHQDYEQAVFDSVVPVTHTIRVQEIK